MTGSLDAPVPTGASSTGASSTEPGATGPVLSPTPVPGPPPGAAAGAGTPDLTADRLPCGRSTDELLDLVLDGHAAPPDDRRDEHQRTCVHCRALAAEAERLWDPFRADAATLESPPVELLEAVIATVRTLGRDPVHLVIPGTRGATRISADAIRQIAERAAAAVPGVALALARRARSAPDAEVDDEQEPATGEAAGPDQDDTAPGTGDGIGLSGRHTVLDLAVVTAYGAPIPLVAAAARDAVRAALAAMTTATAVVVDIYVDDITQP